MMISDKVCLMNTDGQIEQLSTPQEMYLEPVSRHAFRFFDETKIMSEIFTNRYLVSRRLSVIFDRKTVKGIPVLRAIVNSAYISFRVQDVDIYGADEPIESEENVRDAVIEEVSYLGEFYDVSRNISGRRIRGRQQTSGKHLHRCVVVTTGGTGLTPDDVTVEAVRPLFDKEMPGFREYLRRLSHDSVGTPAMFSKATTSVVGETVVYALPDSPYAVEPEVERAILPEVETPSRSRSGARPTITQSLRESLTHGP